MRTIDGVLRDVVVQVRADPVPGEYVFISGNSPDLGEWKVSQAVILSKMSPDGNLWGGVIRVPVEQSVQYRYLMCVVVDNDGKQENIVRHWESHLRPRILRPTDVLDGKCDLDIFGFQDDVESIASGWLTSETIVQLKMFNSPVTIWKRKYRDKRISLHVSTIDITRKESDMLGIEDDSTCPDGASHSWPIVEVALMNETGWQFNKQDQFGVIYDPREYVVFQAQMLKPDTIASYTRGELGLSSGPAAPMVKMKKICSSPHTSSQQLTTSSFSQADLQLLLFVQLMMDSAVSLHTRLSFSDFMFPVFQEKTKCEIEAGKRLAQSRLLY